MTLSTYQELFQAKLEEWIADGGDPSRMVTLVNMYQRSDPIARQICFREWAAEDPFACSRCGHPFVPDYGEVEEDDYILCRRCGGR